MKPMAPKSYIPLARNNQQLTDMTKKEASWRLDLQISTPSIH
jgi:hypothetical protein